VGLQEFEEVQSFIDVEDIDDAWGAVPLQFQGNSTRQQRFDAINIVNADSIDHDIQFCIFFNGAFATVIGTVAVPAGAGIDPTIPAVQAVPLLFPDLRGAVFVGNYQLGGGPLVAVTSGKHVYVTSYGGYF